jgi:CubicO group peptidase (beta-lactamase class C family)
LHDAFQLASVSKVITAIAVLQLVEQKKLYFQDTLQSIFPNFPFQPVTIEQLLIHRHGLSNYMYFIDNKRKDRVTTLTNQEVIESFMKWKPVPYYFPGRRYNYSNSGYALLASVVEKVSGQAFDDYVAEHIFKVAGMEDAFIYNKGDSTIKFDTLVQGKFAYGGCYPDYYMNGVMGDKGVYASALDLYKLDKALHEDRLVRQSLLNSAFTCSHPELYDFDNYGYGWRIDESDCENKLVYHFGWWKGFKTYFIRNIKQKNVAIILTNDLDTKNFSKKSILKMMEMLERPTM